MSANPYLDSDPIFHFDADPDPYPTPSFIHVKKSAIFYLFLFTFLPVYLSISVICVIIFSSLDSILNFSGKNVPYSLSLLFVEIDPDLAV